MELFEELVRRRRDDIITDIAKHEKATAGRSRGLFPMIRDTERARLDIMLVLLDSIIAEGDGVRELLEAPQVIEDGGHGNQHPGPIDEPK